MRRWIVRSAGITSLLLITLAGNSAAVGGGGCHTPAGTTEASGQLVSIKDCSFGPTILHAPVGATITWTNDDYLPHAVNGLGWNAIEPYTSANPGARLSHTFGAAGIYPYMCYVHPGMSGVIVIGDASSLPAAAAPPVAPSALPQAPRVESASTSSPTPAWALALFVAGGLAGYLASLLRRLRAHPLASA
jgi:plastocyanin